MNAPPNDGNENVIDIFVLSTSSSVPSLVREQLEPQGYQVTFFSDGTDLLTTLRSGKPNLLICDTSSDTEGYDVCRHIKADDYLWNIPVLVLTGASDLGDLLNVLDSNADNFIALPYDPPYLLSLIEGMLTTPVQRQTAEQIKTQFKIQHDNQVFVVTADRRKLLEFLLSSFEIAVNKSTELSQAQDEVQSLGLSVKKLEQGRQEDNRAISSANENLKAKELKIAELSTRLSDKESEVSEQADQIEMLSHDLDAEKALRITAEEENRRLVQEHDQAVAEHRASSGELQQTVTALSAELETVKKNLDATRDSLSKETALRTERESELESSTALRDRVEKDYQALLLEAGQLRESLAEETKRAEEREKEMNAVLLAKTEAEQGLNRMVADLTTTTKQQEDDIARLRGELESERMRFSHQEDKLRLLYEEKEQNETALRSEIEAERKSTAALQAEYDAMTATLGERDADLKTLNDSLAAANANLADTVANKEQAEILVRSLTNTLEERDQEIKTLKDQAETQALSLTHDLQERDNEIKTLKEHLTSAGQDLAGAIAGKEKAETLAQTLTRTLEETQSALEKEKARSRETEESLNAAILERERALEDLRGAHDEARSSLMNSADDLTRTKQELESIKAQKATLEQNLGATLARIRELEQDLHATTSGKMQTRQQAEALTNELEQAKLALDNERQSHHDTEESLKNAELNRQHLEQEVQRLAHEHKVVESELLAEQQLRREAENQARSLELERDNLRDALKTTDAETRLHDEERSARIQKLKEDFEMVQGLQRTLEEQVATLTRDKAQAEEKAANLAAEIDQARAALADEWEDHMTDHERLAAVAEVRQQAAEVLNLPGKAETEHDEKEALVARSPNLPAATAPLRVTIAEEPVPSPELPQPKPYVLSVEDLFEDDDRPAGKKTDASAAGDESPETASAITGEFPDYPYPSFESEEEEDQSVTPAGSGAEEPDDGEEEQDEPEVRGGSSAGPDIAFNRAQWLDLLKWAHHCEVLTHEQRMQIVRMGRLIQKGRNLTKKQEEQVMEIIVLVQRLGYHFP